MIENRPARAQHRFILRGMAASQLARKNFARAPTEELAFVQEAVAFDQRTIHHRVASSAILDEEDDVRRLIEKLFEQPRIHRQEFV